MCYNQPNSTSNFGTVVFVSALLIGMGLLIYYALDITTENRQLEQSVDSLQVELASRDLEANTLRDEVAGYTLENTSLAEEVARLQGERDLILKEYAALQAYAIELELARATPLQQENNEQQIGLEHCENTETGEEILYASIGPTNPTLWGTIGGIPLFGTVLLGIHIYKTARRKKTSGLDRHSTQQSLSDRRRNTKIIESRFIK